MRRIYILMLLLALSSPSWAQNEGSIPDSLLPQNYFKPVKWRSIGPFRGGRSVAASGVVGDPLTYYMGNTGGGVWKTEDAGQHWNNISDGYFKSGSVGAVAVSESDPQVVYVGMGEHAVRGVMTSHGDGVYKSTDAGKTWVKLGLEKTQHISRIVIHPKNPNLVYVAAQGALYSPSEERGIYRSQDGGKSWERILFVDIKTGCAELSMDMNNPQVLYAAMWEHQRLPWKVISGGPGSGLYKSSDGGASWKKIHKGLPEEKGKMAINVCRSNSNKVYALIESDSNQEKGGLFVSNNAGASWSRISKDHRLVQRAWYYTEVFADPQDEHTVYVLSAPALRSIDGGKTWERLRGTHGDYHDLWINPQNPKNLCIANDGGAAISFNRGKTWSTQANMPTAQFYRVNVDNVFPYRIYGGQQDNSSVRIAHRELNSRGIGTRSWTYSAGGESAFLAFDPDNPRYVLGGSYLGTIVALDTKAEATTRIMAAPIQYIGRDAKDMKYRFNWNAPIIWSQHEPNTFYHGAQYLLRTRDMGKSWEEVSPDLTRNEKEKQGKGGGPYTNEAVGAENYGTLSYVVESPYEKGVIWTGSDDGLVHLSQDGGENWKNVTPKGLSECLINAIEVSPHNKARVYLATTRYKFNDHTPGLYVSQDYGNTWTNISGNIPYGSFTRVVREDPERAGLLYAGTETGMFISYDAGKNWLDFQLNLPVCPITDLIIKHGDMVAATSGRSFWILDDMELIRSYGKYSAQFQLFPSEAAYLSNHGSPLNGNNPNFKGSQDFVGVNPANGVVLYYQLPKLDKKTPLTLKIRNAQGNLVRKFSSQKDSTFSPWAGGPPADPRLSKKTGLNRFVWDMRYPNATGVPGVYIEGSYRGHKAIPGTYSLVLECGEYKSQGTCEILNNPLYGTSPAEYQAFHNFMSEREKELDQMHRMVNKVYRQRKQIEQLLQMLPADSSYQGLKESGHTLINAMKAWDEEMVQRKSKAYDDVENFPNKFTANYMFMINQTDSALPRLNEPSQKRYQELVQVWDKLKNQGREFLDEKVPTLNEQLWKSGIGAIWMDRNKPVNK